ncbi:MAG: iron dependent repressor, metal binding and dimerization domain protein, partial [Thermoplasmatota archaeon]
KGYARVVDIGAHLDVSPPTATKMIQRLDEVGLVVYERYRGIALTAEGEALAKHLRHRHGVLAEFLRLLGVDEATAHRDVEGIEHHLDPATLGKVAAFVEYARKNPEWFVKFKTGR